MARVLVVDDNLAVLELLVGGLVALGHQVQAAIDGEQAREILNRASEGGVGSNVVVAVEVLITDLHMPRLDGFGLVEHVRALPYPLPVVMISGTWTADERARATALGVARLHVKPVDLARLARDVEELAR